MRHISGFGTFYLIDAFFLFVCFLFCVRILVHGGLTLFFYSTTLFSPVSFFVQRRVSIADCNGRILHGMVFALQRLSAQSSFFRFPLSRFLLRPFFVVFRSLRADSSAVYLFVCFVLFFQCFCHFTCSVFLKRRFLSSSCAPCATIRVSVRDIGCYIFFYIGLQFSFLLASILRLSKYISASALHHSVNLPPPPLRLQIGLCPCWVWLHCLV